MTKLPLIPISEDQAEKLRLAAEILSQVSGVLSDANGSIVSVELRANRTTDGHQEAEYCISGTTVSDDLLVYGENLGQALVEASNKPAYRQPG